MVPHVNNHNFSYNIYASMDYPCLTHTCDECQRCYRRYILYFDLSSYIFMQWVFSEFTDMPSDGI